MQHKNMSVTPYSLQHSPDPAWPMTSHISITPHHISKPRISRSQHIPQEPRRSAASAR